jgi:hypothetical protein
MIDKTQVDCKEHNKREHKHMFDKTLTWVACILLSIRFLSEIGIELTMSNFKGERRRV